MENDTLKIRSYTKGQLADIYEVSRKTFNTWLKAHPEIPAPAGYVYTPAQVAMIQEVFGPPPSP